MPPAEVCETCERPKSTPEDLERWNRELGAGYMGTEPAWARALCWTVRGAQCFCTRGLAPATSG